MRTHEEVLLETMISYGHKYDDTVTTITCAKVAMKIYATEAISDHEQTRWKKYPENVPETEKDYYVYVHHALYEAETMYDIYNWDKNFPEDWRYVIAFRELPPKYIEPDAYDHNTDMRNERDERLSR